MLNTDLHIAALKIAAKELNMSENELGSLLLQRMLEDNTVPQEMKDEIIKELNK